MAVRDARRVALAWALLVGAAEGGVRPNSASQRPLRAVARPASAAAAAVGHPPPAPPDAHTLLSRCREHVRAGDAHSALAEFRRMLRCGRPCVRSCNQLLLQLADAGQLNAAVEAYRAMLAAGQPAPTAVTYSTLISRAARAHDRPLAESLFAEMLEIGCQPDTQASRRRARARAHADIERASAALTRAPPPTRRNRCTTRLSRRAPRRVTLRRRYATLRTCARAGCSPPPSHSILCSTRSRAQET